MSVASRYGFDHNRKWRRTGYEDAALGLQWPLPWQAIIRDRVYPTAPGRVPRESAEVGEKVMVEVGAVGGLGRELQMSRGRPGALDIAGEGDFAVLGFDPGAVVDRVVGCVGGFGCCSLGGEGAC